ncbi:hypothetical protein DENIS_2849 [Desulfonema ishimotonii]|uniref:Orotate phosphoribosyltransferase-like domain-containing protein n=1 Tax=Desulfonema ishimotonii TaxID=45657 RepID=A0A401FY31_9BACT|nr:phosphoribosyltransferase domain-containing protein [Desulfonema ishimotonii]GBC61887.1 hypothetical protein DENIS_2849 [Desulfonema ishimotonii]
MTYTEIIPADVPGENGNLCPEKDIFHLCRENNPRRRSAVTFSCLGKLESVRCATFDRWKRSLRSLVRQALKGVAPVPPPLVVGLTESGIIPSALLHGILGENGIDAEWICSTRRAAPGLRFTESHSHGPDHVLPLPCRQPGELWFAEDEITTGRTLLNLCRRLCCHLAVSRVRIFALADMRPPGLRAAFDRCTAADGIRTSVHVLMPSVLSADPGRSEPVPQFSPDVPACDGIFTSGETAPVSDWHFPDIRPALKSQTAPRCPVLPRREAGTILAVGEAVDMGLSLIQKTPGLRLHHLTLSPWEIDGNHILNRIGVGGRYFLYNAHTLRPPIHILNDPVDEPFGRAALCELRRKGLAAEPLRLTL